MEVTVSTLSSLFSIRSCSALHSSPINLNQFSPSVAETTCDLCYFVREMNTTDSSYGFLPHIFAVRSEFSAGGGDGISRPVGVFLPSLYIATQQRCKRFKPTVHRRRLVRPEVGTSPLYLNSIKNVPKTVVRGQSMGRMYEK